MNSEEKLYFNKQWLHKKYEDEELSILEIARMCGVDIKTIWSCLVRFNIKRRRTGRKRRLISETVRDMKYKYAPISSVASPYFFKAFDKFCEQKKETKSEIVRLALTEYMMKYGFNPFKESQDANL